MAGVDPIAGRISAIIKEAPHLADAAHVYQAVLTTIRGANLHVREIPMTKEEAHAKMAADLPLLANLDLELDEQAAHEVMRQIVRSLEVLDCQAGRDIQPIRLAIDEGRLDIGMLLSNAIAGDRLTVEAMARSQELQPDLLWMLASYTLVPALRVWAQQLAPLARNCNWQKEKCFVCGAGALLGELQGDNQAKHARCGHCGADWPVRRLQCLRCGNDDYKTLSYLYADKKKANIRVDVCDACNGYLKVINAYVPTIPEMLVFEDLATLHLDSIARERGYSRGPMILPKSSGL